MATASSLKDLWAGLDYEVMPVLPPLVVRAQAALFGGEDFSLRLLGCAIGILVVLGLWVTARALGTVGPVLSLGLLAVSPVAIVWGDEVRPYGLAMLFGVLTVGAMWRLSDRPTMARWILAATAAGLAVQSAYASAFIVLAACGGAVLLALLRRQPARVLAVLAVGLVAGLSLVPYAGHWSRIGGWSELVRVPLTLGQILTNAFRALNAGPLVGWMWVAAALGAVLLCPRLLGRSRADDRGGAALYAGTVFVIGTVGFFAWLRASAYKPYEWHFLPWLAPATLCLDVTLAEAARGLARARLWLAVLGAALLVTPAWKDARARQSNVNDVAAQLHRDARPDDAVLVISWLQISFRRYYTGPAPVITMPPVGEIGIHRYDLLQRLMIERDPMEAVLHQVGERLRKGGRVWVVGEQPLPGSGEGQIARDGAFTIGCMQDLGDFAARHANAFRPARAPRSYAVIPYEDVTLSVLEGWRD